MLTSLWVRRISPSISLGTLWRDREVSKVVLAFGLLATFGTPVLLAACALGMLDRSFAPYLVAVLLNFGVTLLSFIRLLQSVVRLRTG